MKYYEDLAINESHSSGPRTVTEAEIVEFASRYDPQWFHVDREAAEGGRFGELIASGWHTASVTMQLLVDGLLEDVAVVSAIGVDDLRWRKPVLAGDAIRTTTTIAEKSDWDEETGLVQFDIAADNQNDETVLTRSDLVLVETAAAQGL